MWFSQDIHMAGRGEGAVMFLWRLVRVSRVVDVLCHLVPLAMKGFRVAYRHASG